MNQRQRGQNRGLSHAISLASVHPSFLGLAARPSLRALRALIPAHRVRAPAPESRRVPGGAALRGLLSFSGSHTRPPPPFPTHDMMRSLRTAGTAPARSRPRWSRRRRRRRRLRTGRPGSPGRRLTGRYPSASASRAVRAPSPGHARARGTNSRLWIVPYSWGGT